MPRFDFRCKAGHVVEMLVSRDTRKAECERCGGVAKRELGVPRLPGINGRAITPSDQREVRIGQMQEAAAEVEHAWQKEEYNQDRKIERPDYFRAANGKAQNVLAGKTAPPDGWTDPLKAS